MVWFCSYSRVLLNLYVVVHLLALFAQCHASSGEDITVEVDVDVQSSGSSGRDSVHVRYIMIVDAGSTGSRGFVYQLTSSSSSSDGVQMQHIKAKGMKMTPGVSSFASHTHDLGDYFAPLFVNAASVVPPEHHAAMEVHILGTAGMRLVSEEDQDHIWDRVVAAMQQEERFPFLISRENVRTINGREEAYFAALSTNYIAKKIDSNLMPVEGEQLVGALDMGGSSTQLVLHTGTPPGQRVQESHFWSHSWLSFGVEKVRERVWKYFVHEAKSKSPTPHMKTPPPNTTDNPDGDNEGDNEGEGDDGSNAREKKKKMDIHIPVEGKVSHTPSIMNHCLFRNYSELFFDPSENKNEIYMLHGTGDVVKCKEALRNVLWPEGCTRSAEKPTCSLNNIPHPPIAGKSFFGMSVYYFALDCVRFLGVKNLIHWPVSNLRELVEATEAFCAMDWHDVNGTYDHSVNVNKGRHKKTSIDNLPFRCVEALYMSLLLEEGFGFDLDERTLTLALKVEGVEVEWTLGVLLTKALAHSTTFSSTSSSSSSSTGSSSSSNSSNTRDNDGDGDSTTFENVESIERTLSRDSEETGNATDILDHNHNEDKDKEERDQEEKGKEGEHDSSKVEVEESHQRSSSPEATASQDGGSHTDAATATSSATTAAAAAAAMEGIRVRITALKAAGLSAGTLKQLFPDVDIDEFFVDSDNVLEDDHEFEHDENREQQERPSSPSLVHKEVKPSLRSRIRGWKTAVRQRLILPVTATSSALARHSKRAYGHVVKSFEMFAQVLVVPLDVLRGRSRYVGRWLYRKLFELVHNRPL